MSYDFCLWDPKLTADSWRLTASWLCVGSIRVLHTGLFDICIRCPRSLQRIVWLKDRTRWKERRIFLVMEWVLPLPILPPTGTKGIGCFPSTNCDIFPNSYLIKGNRSMSVGCTPLYVVRDKVLHSETILLHGVSYNPSVTPQVFR